MKSIPYSITLSGIQADTVARQKINNDVSHSLDSGCSNCWFKPLKEGRKAIWGGYNEC